ncbi:MAG: hypothetical protein QM724_02280 [Flavobacteriales bacterium]
MRRVLPALCLLAVFALLLPERMSAQNEQRYVDHWDSLRTKKRSEGLLWNGREWGEWKFWDRYGNLTEVADFKSGEREGHVVIYYDNGQQQHDGWFHHGRQDSTMRSFYRTGQVMEEGAYKKGVKNGPWTYWYPDGKPMLKELWEDSVGLSLDAWDRDSTHTLVNGDGVDPQLLRERRAERREPLPRRRAQR